MATYNTNEFKPGVKILINNEPYSILDTEFVNPGKGQAFYRIKCRNLKNNRVLEKTYKSGESLPGADVEELEMQYLYHDDDLWHFMSLTTFEQCAIPKAVLATTQKWLKPQDICMITLWDQTPISVTPPNFVVLQVKETEPGIKGDTAAGGSKTAILETGASIRVPLFINEKEYVKIDTRTEKYVSREQPE
jgi:elongation factor P